MAKKRINKVGFRTFEMESFEYQRQFFYRFLKRFPQALGELKELLPLFESIFGKPCQLDEHSKRFKVDLFYSRYLLAPDELLLNYCNYQANYPFIANRRKQNFFPDFIQLPINHDFKCNESYYKNVIETSLLFGIAELRAESGDTLLSDVLRKMEEAIMEMEQIKINDIRKICVEQNIEADDFQIGVEAKNQVGKLLDVHKFYENEYFDLLLNSYWTFYKKFHAWLEKYYLQTNWLRRSFFISLYQGLEHAFPDIGASIQLPQELKDELYGEEAKMWQIYHNLPEPESFIFDVSWFSSGKLGYVISQKKWQAEPFSLFYTPPQYKSQEIEKFKQYLSGFELFELEGHILDAFSIFIDGAISNDNSDNRIKLKNEFREHLWNFHLFKSVVEERNKILECFEQHIDKYLEPLLPIIKKYYPTNEGRPHNFEQIEWLLSWNVGKLTAKEILDKFDLKCDEPAIHKAFANLKKYDLPKRKRSKKKETH